MLSTDEVKQAIIEARKIVRMLQGTMSLEGQGFTDRKFLKELQKRATRRILDNARKEAILRQGFFPLHCEQFPDPSGETEGLWGCIQFKQ